MLDDGLPTSMLSSQLILVPEWGNNTIGDVSEQL